MIILSKLYLSASDVSEIMDCSENYAYRVIAGMNEELKLKGYVTRRGRIPRKYFFERTGLSQEEEQQDEQT